MGNLNCCPGGNTSSQIDEPVVLEYTSSMKRKDEAKQKMLKSAVRSAAIRDAEDSIEGTSSDSEGSNKDIFGK
jgi:hypothetical protein